VMTVSRHPASRWWTLGIACLIVLGIANLWATMAARNSVPMQSTQFADTTTVEKITANPRLEDDPEAWAKRLHQWLNDPSPWSELQQANYMRQYERMTVTHENWHAQSREAKLVLGWLQHTRQRSPEDVRILIREVGMRDFNPQIVEILAKQVYQRLVTDE